MRHFVSRAASFNPGAKYIILYNNPMEQRRNETRRIAYAFRMFQLMYNKYNAANLIFMYATDAEKYAIYVTNPYRNANECGSLKPILLDECEAGVFGASAVTMAFVRTSKVPETLPNCTFKFCARITEPYINVGCRTGLEIEMIKALQDILHFKVIVVAKERCRF